MQQKMKRTFYLLMTICMIMSVQSCWELIPSDDLNDSCYVTLVNNSEQDLYIGALTIASPTNKSVFPDTIYDLIGHAYPHDTSGKSELWLVDYEQYNAKEATWKLFFLYYCLDTLEIAVVNNKNVDKLNRWFKERKDSLLLKKYVFTLSDLEKDKRSVTITYP